MSYNYWLRRAAGALPNPGAVGPWSLRVAQGLANFGHFGGSSVGALDGRGHPLAQLWRALEPAPTFGGSTWSQRLAGGGWRAFYDAVVQTAEAGQGGEDGNLPAGAIAFADFVNGIYETSEGPGAVEDFVTLAAGVAVHANGLGRAASGSGAVNLAGAFLADVQAEASKVAGLTLELEVGFSANGLFYFSNDNATNGLAGEIGQNAGSGYYDLADYLGPSSTDDSAATGAVPVTFKVGMTLGAGRYCGSVAGSTPSDAVMGTPNPLADGAPYIQFEGVAARVRTITLYPAKSNAELAAATA